MKKCPKCGTILDDSKKQCYMCGTNLEVNKIGVSQSRQIGAVVSSGQDNVFNNGEDIRFKEKDVVKKNTDNVYFSQNSNSSSLNSLNSIETDKRNFLQKGLDSLFGNKKFRDNTEITSTKKAKKMLAAKAKAEETSNVVDEPKEIKGPQQKKKPIVAPEPVERKPKIEKVEEPVPEPRTTRKVQQQVEKKSPFDFFNENSEEESKHDFGFTKSQKDEPKNSYGFAKTRNNEAKGFDFDKITNKNRYNNKNNNGNDLDFGTTPKEKPNIFEGLQKSVSPSNNINNSYNEPEPKKRLRIGRTRGYKDHKDDFRFDGQVIFNIMAIAFFCFCVWYVWNHVVNKEVDETLSGLVYEIDPDFDLKSKDKVSRYYVYNSNCTVKINVGADTSTEAYLQGIKDTYGTDKDALGQYEELKINGNTWSSLAIIYYDKNSNSIGGKTPLARYRYTAITYKGDFFAIIFVNTYEDATCQSKYDRFIKTLNFKEG